MFFPIRDIPITGFHGFSWDFPWSPPSRIIPVLICWGCCPVHCERSTKSWNRGRNPGRVWLALGLRIFQVFVPQVFWGCQELTFIFNLLYFNLYHGFKAPCSLPSSIVAWNLKLGPLVYSPCDPATSCANLMPCQERWKSTRCPRATWQYCSCFLWVQGISCWFYQSAARCWSIVDSTYQHSSHLFWWFINHQSEYVFDIQIHPVHYSLYTNILMCINIYIYPLVI